MRDSGDVQRLQQVLAGRYEIEREVGQGGMATVYAARDLRHRRRVAIKVLRPELAIGIAGERFRAEIDIAASLTHPNILPVFDSGGGGDCLFYVMPLVEGESLRTRLEREQRVDLDTALRITCDVADALTYAHGRHIVHRDIKPENILFIEGHAVLADFGIARAIEQAGGGSKRLTFAGMAVGTPLYMSPEQASGDPKVDLRSDVYSLACVLYEMIGGGPPHPGDTPQAMLASKLTETPVPLHSGDAKVPLAIDDVIAKALASEPQERYASAKEFADALTNATAGRVSQRRQRGRRVRMHRGGVVAIFGVLAALGIAGAIAAWRRVPVRIVGDDGRVGVAVLPFRPTVPDAVRWSEAIPDLLATTLDGTPGVRVADPWSLWRTLRETPHAVARSPDPKEAEEIAKRANVCCYVLGSVAELPGQVDVSIRIYQRGAAEPLHTFAMSSPADSIASLVQGIAVEVMKRLTTATKPLALAQIDRALTRSPEALKAWLAAREQQRRGQIDSADVAISRAIALDSSFVLALVDATTIKSWVQFVRGEAYSGLRRLAERAAQLSDSLALPERPRLRAHAMLALINTQGRAAAYALDRIIALDSLDLDAWSSLAYSHMVYGWQYGRTEHDATAATERAVRLDPTNVPLLVRRLYLAVAMNDAGDIDAQLRRVRQSDTSSAIVRATLRGVGLLRVDDAGFSALADRAATLPVPEWIGAFRMLRAYRPDRTDLLIQHTRRAASGQLQRVATGAEVQLSAAEGRFHKVDSLRRAGAFADIPGFDRVVDRMMVATAIGGAGDETLAHASAATLARNLPPDSARAWLQTHPVWLEGWLIGAYEAMYGDTVLARRWAEALGSLPEGGSPRRYGAALRSDVEARVAARAGDRTRALALAQRAFELWDVHTENQQELMPEPAMRFHLGVLLRAANRPDSAAALFQSLVPPTTWMGFYTARAALELGEIEDARNNHADAQRHLLTAIRLWERGDSVVAPLRDRARRAAGERGR